HTRGVQVVVVESGGRPVVVGGDVAVWFGELDEPRSEGQLRVRALDPELVWLAHEHEPWRPRPALGIAPAPSGPPGLRSGPRYQPLAVLLGRRNDRPSPVSVSVGLSNLHDL